VSIPGFHGVLPDEPNLTASTPRCTADCEKSVQ
jgi:hypothetical protein